ncbi:MAG: bifunctional metallophosphatase/5'-nucleotidase [Lachnospiraceae bacterium]|nr:bifunctional metallophosphatase/5'-nucleotidase [Lachnospiraceae bacterium]
MLLQMLEKSDAFCAAGTGVADGDLGTHLSGEICGVPVGVISIDSMGSCGLDGRHDIGMKNFLCKKISLWMLMITVLAEASLAVVVAWQFTGRESAVQDGSGAIVSDAVSEKAAGGRSTDKIMILYTNDIHCSIEAGENAFGLSQLKELKGWMKNVSEYVTLVDCGDAVQGEVIGTLSEGEYMVELMNEAGYDICTFGNHEFDYGMEQGLRIAEQLSDAQYVSCNFVDLVSGKTVVSPYVLVDYDGISVAYVGICTPETITASAPGSFMDENGNFIYGFRQGKDGTELYDAVQSAVNDARAEGADYVIAVAHLGISEKAEPYRSTDVIAHTTGIDVMLDGHSHSVIQSDAVKNKEGAEVLLSSTGSRLANVGCLVIDTKGTEELLDDSITTSLVSAESRQSMDMSIEQIMSEYGELLDTVAAHAEVELSTLSENGNRMVRCRETNIGDFCADAYRAVSGADVAVINGGGIRSDIPAGDITYNNFLSVNPFGNTVCVVESSGQEILDMLEMAYAYVEAEYENADGPVGESAGFMQVSGLKLVIDTNITSTVLLDENGMFKSVSGERRVGEVQVLNKLTGKYEEIDPEKIYTLASNNYILHSGGDGFGMFMDNKFVLDEFILDNQALIDYAENGMGGSVGIEYQRAQGRIEIR